MTIPMFTAQETDDELRRIAAGLSWSDPRRVFTRFGERLVREAAITNAAFWRYYRLDHSALQRLSMQLEDRDGAWFVIHWMPVHGAAQKLRKRSAADIAAEISIDRQKVRESSVSVASFDVPSPNGCVYLEYQKAAIYSALNRTAGTLLADDMGLGKTISALGVVNADPSINRVLIVCPSSVKIHWSRESKKWLTRPITTDIVASGKKPPRFDKENSLVVINYEMLRKYADELRVKAWDIIILDEAHYIKNPNAKRTEQVVGSSFRFDKGTRQWEQAVAPLPARRRMALTGTPISRSVEDLWTVVSWLDPKYWGQTRSIKDHLGFLNRYTIPQERLINNRPVIVERLPKNLAELQQRLRSSVMTRRSKDDVLDELPEKRRRVIVLEPTTGAERQALRSERKYVDSLASLDLTRGAHADFEEIAERRHETALAKVPKVTDYIMESLANKLDTDRHIVVFAHHHDVMDAIAEVLDQKGISNCRCTGRVGHARRQRMVDDFQAGRIQVFIGGIEAAGVGLTLTRSSHVVFAELAWSPSTLAQAEDRTHRVGQRNSVLVEHIVLEESLDAKLLETIEFKTYTLAEGVGLSQSSRIIGSVASSAAQREAIAAMSRRS